MGKERTPEERTLQRLDLVNGYLDDAKDVLWNISNDISSNETGAEINDLLEDLWELQNRVSDLQPIDEESTAEFDFSLE